MTGVGPEQTLRAWRPGRPSRTHGTGGSRGASQPNRTHGTDGTHRPGRAGRTLWPGQPIHQVGVSHDPSRRQRHGGERDSWRRRGLQIVPVKSGELKRWNDAHDDLPRPIELPSGEQCDAAPLTSLKRHPRLT